MSPARNILSKSRLNSLLVLLLCCLPASLVRAEGRGAESRLTSAHLVEAKPGTIVTASILVANRSEAEAMYEEAFTIPPAWRLISPLESHLSLQPGEQKLRVIAFAIPATSPEGSFDLKYALTTSGHVSPAAISTLTVIVLPVVKLELLREDQTDTVIAGEIYEARLRLINRGNNKIRVSIEAVCAPVAPVHLMSEEVWLEAAASLPFHASIQTDVELQRTTPQAIRFKASAVAPDGTVISATQSVVIKLIPRVSGDRDPYVTLPAQVRMIGVAEDGRTGAQAEISGAGFVDEARTHHVEFLFRGPSLESKSLYGLRDEFRISYAGPKLQIALGDQNYPLSPLIQRFNYGRGAAVNFNSGPVTAGSFYMKTLDRVRNFETGGLYLRREFTPAVSVQANTLYKSESGFLTQTGPLGLFSLQPHLNFGRSLDLDLEYGVSTGGSGTSAHAHRIEARGQLFEEVTYSVERVRAGNDFFGYYHGTESTQAAIFFPIAGRLRGKASFNQDEREAAQDLPRQRPLPDGISSTRQSAYRPGLLFRVSSRTDLSLEYQNIERHATRISGAQQSLEHSARIGAGHHHGKLSVQTFAELGTSDKSASTTMSVGREAVERYSAFLSYRPTTRQSYSFFGTIGSSTTFDLKERSQSLGASASWNVSDRLSAGLNYARNRYDSQTARVQNTATGMVCYTFPNRNAVAVQGRWFKDSTTGETGASVVVSYTIPFKLRTSKKKSGGVIRGRIFESEGGAPRPLSRVIVTTNGITAVTDRDGQFVFLSLTPGLYPLNIEQRSLGADYVTLEPLPTVEVNRGGTVELSIGVVRASRVSAKVMVFASASRLAMLNPRVAGAAAFTPTGGLAGGLVELRNGNETLRQVTDRDGDVAFENLRPGKWTMRVYQNNVPDHHAIETPETHIELKPGQSAETVVRVLPRFRRVQLIDAGTIVP